MWLVCNTFSNANVHVCTCTSVGDLDDMYTNEYIMSLKFSLLNLFKFSELRPVTPPSDIEENSSSPRETKEKIDISSPSDKNIKTDNNNNNNSVMIKSKEVAPTTPDVRKHPRPPTRIVKVSPTNSDLLCKLFDGVEANEKKKSGIRRGR